MSGAEPRAIVVGGGFSGAMTAAHLLRRGQRVALIEPRPEPGRGAAYSTSGHDLTLNVPALHMSAWPDDPDDFVRWLGWRGARVGSHGFAPRALYGRYVAETLAAAGAAAPGALSVHRATAVDVERLWESFVVTLADGTAVAGDALVLALGNAPPRRLHALCPGSRARVIDDPVSELDRLAPDRDATIGIVGSGLTALDVVVRATRLGHCGRIVLVSRHGLLPTPHLEVPAADLPAPPAEMLAAPSVRGLLVWLRSLSRELERQGRPPARAVDALRPHAAEVWKRLGDRERARFLRHARPYWDAHRHRLEPAGAALLACGLAEGRIERRRGRFLGHASGADGVRVHLRRRGGGEEVVHVDWLLNGTGPERDLDRLEDRLVRSLVRRQLVRPHPSRLGAATGDAGELIDAHGAVVPGAFVVGPWRIGAHWESVAVPELRVQAARAAVSAEIILRARARAREVTRAMRAARGRLGEAAVEREGLVSARGAVVHPSFDCDLTRLDRSPI